MSTASDPACVWDPVSSLYRPNQRRTDEKVQTDGQETPQYTFPGEKKTIVNARYPHPINQYFDNRQVFI